MFLELITRDSNMGHPKHNGAICQHAKSVYRWKKHPYIKLFAYSHSCPLLDSGCFPHRTAELAWMSSHDVSFCLGEHVKHPHEFCFEKPHRQRAVLLEFLNHRLAVLVRTFSLLGGIIHPKIKMVIIILSPSRHYKAVWISFFWGTKEAISKNVGNQAVWITF